MLGQNQDCYAGCFDPETSFSGDLADVRIWDEVLTQVASWPLTVVTAACVTSLDINIQTKSSYASVLQILLHCCAKCVGMIVRLDDL